MAMCHQASLCRTRPWHSQYNWQIAQVGDFNGDGKDGILWTNTATGDLSLWNSNPGTVSFTNQDLGNVNVASRLAAT
jgi:hypothetical protein